MNDLGQEGSFLHKRMFGFEAPPEILAQYQGYLEGPGKGTPCPAVAKCRELNVNPIAVEYALRLHNRKNPLTQRMEVLSLLCEVHPLHYTNYYSDRGNLCGALFKLGFHGMKAAALLIRGNYLLWRHSID